MNKILCLALDDEPLALSVIEYFCSRLPQLEVISFNSPPLAVEFLQKNTVDIIFLDINMPEMHGLEIAATIPKETLIIFTTAYQEYALDSYNYNTVDYLLKPFDFDRFSKAIDKALELIEQRKEKHTIPIRIDYRYVPIATEDILYIEAMGNYLKIHTQEKTHLTQMTMKEIEGLLNDKQFKRIHRSYIINLRALDSLSRKEVCLGNVTLPISKSYLSTLSDLFG